MIIGSKGTAILLYRWIFLRKFEESPEKVDFCWTVGLGGQGESGESPRTNKKTTEQTNNQI